MTSCGQERTTECLRDVNENICTPNGRRYCGSNHFDEEARCPRRLSDGGGSGGGGTRRLTQSSGRAHLVYRIPPAGIRSPSQLEEQRFRICIILIASWLFMAVSGLFLICYVYLLEWSPEIADPIQVFSLEVAVIMLYVIFIVDILVSIAIIVSQQDYSKPFRFRIYWPAIGFLCLNHIHGTFVWFWCWTGEFPRSCSQNSYYLGRRCQNLANGLVINSDGTLRLRDCKCDYGACLPECKGLRLIQHYFWSTFWLYILRTVMLIICIPWLREAICGCKCCCCIDPKDNQAVQPSVYLNNENIESNNNYCPYNECCCPYHCKNVCDHSCHQPRRDIIESCQGPQDHQIDRVNEEKSSQMNKPVFTQCDDCLWSKEDTCPSAKISKFPQSKEDKCPSTKISEFPQSKEDICPLTKISEFHQSREDKSATPKTTSEMSGNYFRLWEDACPAPKITTEMCEDFIRSREDKCPTPKITREMCEDFLRSKDDESPTSKISSGIHEDKKSKIFDGPAPVDSEAITDKSSIVSKEKSKFTSNEESTFVNQEKSTIIIYNEPKISSNEESTVTWKEKPTNNSNEKPSKVSQGTDIQHSFYKKCSKHRINKT